MMGGGGILQLQSIIDQGKVILFIKIEIVIKEVRNSVKVKMENEFLRGS
jgi:hypothetical protein